MAAPTFQRMTAIRQQGNLLIDYIGMRSMIKMLSKGVSTAHASAAISAAFCCFRNCSAARRAFAYAPTLSPAPCTLTHSASTSLPLTEFSFPEIPAGSDPALVGTTARSSCAHQMASKKSRRWRRQRLCCTARPATLAAARPARQNAPAAMRVPPARLPWGHERTPPPGWTALQTPPAAGCAPLGWGSQAHPLAWPRSLHDIFA